MASHLPRTLHIPVPTGRGGPEKPILPVFWTGRPRRRKIPRRNRFAGVFKDAIVARVTREDLTGVIREAMLRCRVLHGDFSSVSEAIGMAGAARWPDIGRGRRDGLARRFQKTFEAACSRVAGFAPFFSAELSDSLRNRLASVLAVAGERRAVLLQWWASLPTADRALVEARYRHPDEPFSPDELVRFSRNHLELLHLLDRETPVADSVGCESAEDDLTMLILERMFDDFTEERRLVLETLLIGEPGNQSFFVRMGVVVAELEWLLSPRPAWETLDPPEPVPLGERALGWAFIAGCVLAAASVTYAAYVWLFR